VLGGSSGRVEVGRCRLLAARDVAAASVRWFGGPGQPPGICEVPLEQFAPVLDRVADLAPRLALVGTSKGAEAVLLLAADDERVAVTCALAPTSVVWANVGPGPDGAEHPPRSSWTREGRPLPFVAYDDSWATSSEPPAYVGLYESSLARFADRAVGAAIPVERIPGTVLVSSGGDDQVWPSATFAQQIAERRHGLPTISLHEPLAGHRAPWPGEEPPPAGGMARGGGPEADAALGRRAWDGLLAVLLP
jgi:hypothetical protein